MIEFEDNGKHQTQTNTAERRLIELFLFILGGSFVLWPWVIGFIDIFYWFFTDAHLITWSQAKVFLCILWPIGWVFAIGVFSP